MAAYNRGQRRGVRRQPDAAGRDAARPVGLPRLRGRRLRRRRRRLEAPQDGGDARPRRRPPRCAPAPTSTAGAPTGTSTRRYARGLITEKDLDRALVRLFTARFRLGLFDPPDARALVGARAPRRSSPPPTSRSRARPRARSIVLLENRAGALPLAPSVRRLAVVGPMADDLPVLLANYHGIPSHPVQAARRRPRRGARPRHHASVTPPARGWSRRRPRAIAAAVAVARATATW